MYQTRATNRLILLSLSADFNGSAQRTSAVVVVAAAVVAAADVADAGARTRT